MSTCLFIGSVGNRQYYEEVLKEIALQKLENHVTIIPGLPHESRDLINAYKAADCFILPSLHELSGMAVLEAWLPGCRCSRETGSPSPPHRTREERPALRS